jgi:hypothetical protein
VRHSPRPSAVPIPASPQASRSRRRFRRCCGPIYIPKWGRDITGIGSCIRSTKVFQTSHIASRRGPSSCPRTAPTPGSLGATLIGSWLGGGNLHEFLDAEVYEAWRVKSGRHLAPDEILGIKVPVSFGDQHALESFEVQNILSYYQNTGPPHRAKAFEQMAGAGGATCEGRESPRRRSSRALSTAVQRRDRLLPTRRVN